MRGHGSTRHAPTVLIVESDDDTREMYAEYLRYIGFGVEAAVTTDDALLMMNGADALVTDIAVRGTLDGFGFVSRVRQEHARTPIIVVTTNTIESYRPRAIAAGADVFLVKPCLPKDLARETHRVLASAAARSASVVSIVPPHTTMAGDGADRITMGIRTNTSPLSALLQELTTEARRHVRLGGAPITVLRRLVDALGVSALVADNAGTYIMTNAEASALTGYSADELRRLSVWQLTPDANEHEAETLWRAFLLQGEQRGDYPLLTKNGNIVMADYAARAHVLPNLHVSLLRLRESL